MHCKYTQRRRTCNSRKGEGHSVTAPRFRGWRCRPPRWRPRPRKPRPVAPADVSLRLGDARAAASTRAAGAPPTTSSTGRPTPIRRPERDRLGRRRRQRRHRQGRPIAGLQPLTVYHYRLVAVNARRRPRSATTTPSRRPRCRCRWRSCPRRTRCPSAAPVTVQGTLSGTGNAGRQVVLQGRPFPFTAPFQPIGNPELTTATGGFSFTLLGAATTIQFRGRHDDQTRRREPDRDRERGREGDEPHRGPTRHGFARVYGTVTPAEDGAEVGILRIVARPRRARRRHDPTPPRHHQLELQPGRARAQRRLPRAGARRGRRPGLQLRPAAA